ncbi:MAG: insulinase family protein [Bacteroidales bacterium]|nr:insulinase family protein [Bacteroidales bacterium]
MAIPFTRQTLANGLHVLVHEDRTTPLAACTIVYRVGSRDEDPACTGIAHLMEHFMFSGSDHAPDFDLALQKVGAINNAYTSQDLTCYYIVLPANNIETALWLESDRMAALSFSQQGLDVQKQVVMEEFKETCLNQPYGDLMMHVYGLSYRNHPYQWLPIGKELSHIEQVDMNIIRRFHDTFYCPANAILVVAGNVHAEEIFAMADKWFGDILPGRQNPHRYPQESPSKENRLKVVEKPVPDDMLFKSWLMPARTGADYCAYDLLSDILGTGQSSYLYRKFVMESRLFTDISASVSGSADKGLFFVNGRPAEGISIEQADEQLTKYLADFQFNDKLSYDLQKVKNNAESIILERNLKVEDRANTLATGEFYSRAEDFADERTGYFAVTEEDIRRITETMFKRECGNTLYYCKV